MQNSDRPLEDSAAYREKKRFFDSLLTIYGRQSCKEALADKSIRAVCLHLADSNRPAAVLDDCVSLAEERGIEVRYHSKAALSRLSKNGRQDQGIALDTKPRAFASYEAIGKNSERCLIALNCINNPNNLGMIARSVAAAPDAAILYDPKGSAPLDAMVLKASAGTLFRTPLYRGPLFSQLRHCKEQGYRIVGLDGSSEKTFHSLFSRQNAAFELDSEAGRFVFVLGNEHSGLDREVRRHLDETVSIKMNNQVESLNLAVTASLIAMRSALLGG